MGHSFAPNQGGWQDLPGADMVLQLFIGKRTPLLIRLDVEPVHSKKLGGQGNQAQGESMRPSPFLLLALLRSREPGPDARPHAHARESNHLSAFSVNFF